MNRDMENAPAHMFDWLEQYSFDALTAAQQQEVLQYTTADEYDAMHRAAMELKSAKHTQPVAGREEVKQDLLMRMQQQHSAPVGKVVALQGVSTVWRAAAIILLMISCGLAYYIVSDGTAAMAGLGHGTDTVYVARAVPGPRVVEYDTIYLQQEQQQARRSPGKQVKTVAKAPAEHTQNVPAATNFSVLTPEDYERRANTSKGNSLKDEPLAERFTFVNL